MNGDPKRAFDWYQALLELGRFEVQHARQRFFELAKLHLAVGGAILALCSYAIANDKTEVLLLAMLVAAFGIYNAAAWLQQIRSASTWESRWYLSAAKLEESDDFRDEVGVRELKVWSHPEIVDRNTPENKTTGASQAVYRSFAGSLIFFYAAVIAGAAFMAGCAQAT